VLRLSPGLHRYQLALRLPPACILIFSPIALSGSLKAERRNYLSVVLIVVSKLGVSEALEQITVVLLLCIIRKKVLVLIKLSEMHENLENDQYMDYTLPRVGKYRIGW
jgi:nucleoid-associated protein YejK